MKRSLSLLIVLFGFFATLSFAENNEMTQPEQAPNYVYKILTEMQWLKMDEHEFHYIYGSVMDKKDGYMHLSQAHQVEKIAKKYFEHLEKGRLVKLDYKKIADQIKWEPNSKGELFPHCYDPISKDAIVESINFNTQAFDYSQLDR